mmetsp:Transcript_36423/g.120038  ORF Transcript_36423/g.120038 Transcript_36423/m.120038 type:complete len:590 (-) Transcript_36423:1692-3461(-)
MGGLAGRPKGPVRPRRRQGRRRQDHDLGFAGGAVRDGRPLDAARLDGPRALSRRCARDGPLVGRGCARGGRGGRVAVRVRGQGGRRRRRVQAAGGRRLVRRGRRRLGTGSRPLRLRGHLRRGAARCRRAHRPLKDCRPRAARRLRHPLRPRRHRHGADRPHAAAAHLPRLPRPLHHPPPRPPLALRRRRQHAGRCAAVAGQGVRRRRRRWRRWRRWRWRRRRGNLRRERQGGSKQTVGRRGPLRRSEGGSDERRNLERRIASLRARELLLPLNLGAQRSKVEASAAAAHREANLLNDVRQRVERDTAGGGGGGRGRRRWGRAAQLGPEERVVEQLGDGRAEGGLPLQAAPQHVHHVRVARGREGDCLARVGDRLQLLVDGAQVREGGVPVHHLVEDAAEGPDVRGAAELELALGRGVVTLARDRLRRHVVDSPDLRVARDLCRVGARLLGDAKVDQLERALDAEEVGGLEVGVDHARLVDGVDRGQHLLPVHADEGLGEGAVALRAALPLQHVREVDLAALHHQVDGLLLELDLRVDEPDDVRVELPLLEQLHQRDLVGHGLEQLFVAVALDLLEREDLAARREHLEDL